MRGPAAWRFLLRLVVTRDNVDLGLQTARLVAKEVLHDAAATIKHGHRREGCDIEGQDGAREVKLKLHLISNKNHVVDTNVTSYKRRKGPDRGILVVTPVVLVATDEIGRKAAGKMLNMLLEVIILVVIMTHDSGEKSLVTAGDIITTAKQALAKEFPGRKYEEMDREELVAMLQVQGMQTLDAQIEGLESMVSAVESKVDAVESKVDAVESKVESITQELSEIKMLLQQLLKKA